MSIEECVKKELSCYLVYNQPEINSSPLKWWKCNNKDILYISLLANFVQPVTLQRGCSVPVDILLQASTVV